MNPSEITCEYLPSAVYVPEPTYSTFTEHLLYRLLFWVLETQQWPHSFSTCTPASAANTWGSSWALLPPTCSQLQWPSIPRRGQGPKGDTGFQTEGQGSPCHPLTLLPLRLIPESPPHSSWSPGHSSQARLPSQHHEGEGGAESGFSGAGVGHPGPRPFPEQLGAGKTTVSDSSSLEGRTQPCPPYRPLSPQLRACSTSLLLEALGLHHFPPTPCASLCNHAVSEPHDFKIATWPPAAPTPFQAKDHRCLAFTSSVTCSWSWHLGLQWHGQYGWTRGWGWKLTASIPEAWKQEQKLRVDLVGALEIVKGLQKASGYAIQKGWLARVNAEPHQTRSWNTGD